MASNNIRLEFSANLSELNVVSDKLEELKRQQIELARVAQSGEKALSDVLQSQMANRRETIALEKLLSNARKSTADEQKKAANDALIAENLLNGRLANQKGILQELRAELKQLRKAREESFDVTEINKYTSAIERTQAEINKLSGANDKFKGSNGFWQETRQLIVAAFAVDAIKDFGVQLFRNQLALESSQTAIRNISKSAADYETSIKFLNATSNKYGQDLVVLTNTYKGFLASSESSGLALKERNRIYESVIKAGSALKLNNEQVEGSLLAISQMFSKGNVSAEELRGQLGERLPGAFNLMAKALGVSTKELNKMLEQGQVLATDALPKLATVLEKTYGSQAANNVNTFTGAFNRLKNAVTNSFDSFFKASDANAILAKSINFLADNFANLAKGLGIATAAFAVYKIAQVASLALSKAKLIIQGEAILLTTTEATAMNVLTASQARATVAAAAFNEVLKKNPLILAASIATAAYLAYQAFGEQQEELTKKTAEALAPLELQRIKFNELSKAVLSTTIAKEDQKIILDELKKQYPELLDGISKLSTAELILKNNKIKTNATLDYRKDKLEELKILYPEQLKGINTLEDAERRLSGVMKQTNADYKIRANNIQLDLIIQQNANLVLAQSDEALQLRKSANARKNMTDIFGYQTITASKENQRAQELENKVVQNMKVNDRNIAMLQANQKALTFTYEEEGAKVNKIVEKGAKQKAEIEKNYAAEKEIRDLKALKKTFEVEELILRKQLEIDKEKLKGHKHYAQEVEILEADLTIALVKLKEEYGQNLIKLFSAELQSIKNKNKAKLGIDVTYAKDIDKLDKDIAKNSEKVRIESLKVEDGLRLIGRIAAAKSSKEIVKIKEDEMDKILLEEYLYHKRKKDNANLNFEFVKSMFKEDTKQHKEALNDKLEADEKYLNAADKLTQQKLDKAEKDRVKRLEAAFAGIGEIVNQTFGLIEKNLQKSFDSTDDLVKKAQIENQRAGIEIAKQGISAISAFASGNIAQGVVQTIGLIFKGVDLIINASKRKAEAEFKTMTNLLGAYAVESEKAVSAFVSNQDRIIELYSKIQTSSGDFVIDIKTDPKIEALFATLAQFSKNIIEFEAVIQRSGLKIEDLLNIELKRAENLTSTYNGLISKENERFQKEKEGYEKNSAEAIKKIEEVHQAKLKSINDSYDLELRKINEIYAKKSELATANFNKETFEINQAGITQLEALITNEVSLNSVREEFAKKRLDVLNAFPLANKAITDGMTAAEIESINASVKARDNALASLQKNYFDELVNIANAEGQKRKEYTDTEKIQKDIADRLYLAKLKFDADEIVRIKEKNDAILLIEKDKDKAILLAKSEFDLQVLIQKSIFDVQVEDAEKKHKENLLAIDADYNLKIQESYKITTALLETLSQQITKALTNTALRGTEEYKKLEKQLESVSALLEKLKNGNGVPIVVPNIITDGIRIGNFGGGFADGTDRLPRKSGMAGIDTELILGDAGERIMKTKDNNALNQYFGRDLKNTEIVKMLTTPTKMPVFVNSRMTGDINELVQREMNLKFNVQMDTVAKSIQESNKKVVDKLDSLPLNVFNWDNQGFSKSTRTRNTFVTQKRNRYYGSL